MNFKIPFGRKQAVCVCVCVCSEAVLMTSRFSGAWQLTNILIFVVLSYLVVIIIFLSKVHIKFKSLCSENLIRNSY